QSVEKKSYQSNQLNYSTVEQCFFIAAMCVADVAPALEKVVGAGREPERTESIAFDIFRIYRRSQQLPNARTVCERTVSPQGRKEKLIIRIYNKKNQNINQRRN